MVDIHSLSLSVKKPTAQMAHLVFPTHKPTLKKPKEPFFSNARQKTAKK